MKLLTSLTLNVEVAVGTTVHNAARDLCALANRIGMLVEADFNGVKLWAWPDDKPQKLVDIYDQRLNNMSPYKITEKRKERAKK